MLHRIHGFSAHLFRSLSRWREPSSYRLELAGPIFIRYSRDGDEAALERLAALDSRTLPEGSFLLAEIDGELVAAAAPDLDAEPLSDPFRPTANLRRLLELQARHRRRSRGGLARTAGVAPHALRQAA